MRRTRHPGSVGCSIASASRGPYNRPMISTTTGLYYDFRHAPSDSALPVVYLNGIGMTISHWQPLVELLPLRPTLLHDFRDQLRSPRARSGYTMQAHIDDLVSLLDELGIERALLVGTSYGAEVAMLVALAEPDRCAGLVLIDGVSESDARLKAAVTSWKSAALADPVAFYRSLIPWNYSATYIDAHAADLAAREGAVASLPRDYFEGFARLCDAFLALDITDRLTEIACPTLVIVAENDILKDQRYSRIIHERIAGSQLEVIPGAGHAVVLEDPESLAAVIARWIDAQG